MQKRGQITIFMIIGIIIIVLVGSLLYLRSILDTTGVEVEGMSKTEKLFAPIKNYITLCLKEVGDSALRKVGISGGYTYIPNNVFKIENTSYWYNNGDVHPPLSMIENRIDEYINFNLTKCTNFEVFNSEGFDIEYKQPYANTTIAENNIFIQVDYPIIAKKRGAKKEFSSFNMDYNIKFKGYYDVAKNITKKMGQPGFDRVVPLQFNGINVTYKNINDNLIVTLNKTDSDYIFKFAGKFGGNPAPPGPNPPPPNNAPP